MDRSSLKFSSSVLSHIFLETLKKCNPFTLIHNPVIFITELGACAVFFDAFYLEVGTRGFSLHIAIWLAITVLFANAAEAIAEIRNHAQANALKSMRVQTKARLIDRDGTIREVGAQDLKKGDCVEVRSGDLIPGDGEIIEGLGEIDESAISGESEPVIRGAGTDQNSVTSGTRLLSDKMKIQITSNPGESFIDRMIGLIEGVKREKSKNEIALTILISGLALIFFIVCATFRFFGSYFNIQISTAMLVAFLICLIPTTIGGLLSAIGIAGMNRLMHKNVLAMNRQAVEAAGDIDVILIDKTGTITEGKRHATEFIPRSDLGAEDFARAAYLASYLDETTEGRSIAALALRLYPHFEELPAQVQAKFVPFRAETRLSSTHIGEVVYHKGAQTAIEALVVDQVPEELDPGITKIAQEGGTPLVLAEDRKVLGVIALKDILKPGLADQFMHFRGMGIKTVMMTGDNQLTASTIAKEVKVDDFIAEVSPEQKLRYLQKMQAQGLMVAMTGDGINDAPALAQANLGVAMHAGTQAAKEAANMIDLDSHPIKLFEIIEIGKQMLMTRGALTTFSVATDIAKYFAILPSMLIPSFSAIAPLDIMHLGTPESAVLSAVIFNALVIIGLVPLAFKGVRFKPWPAHWILNRNLLLYGLGGIILPFICIKGIDLLIDRWSSL